MDVELDIKFGHTFKNIDDFASKLEVTAQNHFVQYYKRDSRTIEAAKKKVKRYLNPDLKFYQCKYTCIHGGREHVPSGSGKRHKKTLRNEDLCPAFITLRASKSGNELEVIEINNHHNHKIDKDLFAHLPQQRRLPPEIREEAKRLMGMKANKHMVREAMEKKCQKVIKLKDLSNLRQESRQEYANSVEAAVKKINNKFESDCHLLIDTNDQFRGLFFCTSAMKAAVQAYPEIICIDATYKLLNIRAPVYLILIEDGNGESQVVCVGILVSEDKESLRWFLNKFISINPECHNTLNVMADKDWNEREVLRECFPQAKLLICLFHVFKIFQREITIEKMKITSSERSLALQVLQEIAFARNLEEFEKVKDQINKNLSKSVVDYLDKQWINIFEEWCPLLGLKISNFMNHTNNRIEGINAKLKSVITKNSSLEEFLDHLFVILKSLEKEKMHRMADTLNKRTINHFKPNTPEYNYCKYVSEYAFQKILTQLKSLNHVKILSVDENLNFTIKSSHGENTVYNTTRESCTCYFFNSMGLPCKHIFAVLKKVGQDLFNEHLVQPRWSQAYTG